ncbi:hypothetical protein ACHAXA_003311 [Cyclostephanos tholiformis]|uniref:Uncharacterized protein n=1 Tax=Cyclostephanos tholiformis TaxID=382380 RepID=A0ABD3SBB7_9STRA
MTTIPGAILHNNLTTKVSNLTPSSTSNTRPSLSVSFSDAHAVHFSDIGVDDGNNNNNNNNCRDDDDVSDYFVPHLMRASSQDEDDDVNGSFFDNGSDHPTSTLTSPNRIPPSPVESRAEEGELSDGT